MGHESSMTAVVAIGFWLFSLLCVVFVIEEKWRRSLFTKRDVFL